MKNRKKLLYLIGDFCNNKSVGADFFIINETDLLLLTPLFDKLFELEVIGEYSLMPILSRQEYDRYHEPNLIFLMNHIVESVLNNI